MKGIKIIVTPRKQMGKKLDKLRSEHPDLDIHVKYSAAEYNNYRNQTLKALNNDTTVDVRLWIFVL